MGHDVTEQELYDAARREGLWGFWKVNRDLLGPDDTLTYPQRTERLDYEGEVAIILGKAGKNLSQAQARDAVWGVTLFVDWSIRDGGGAALGIASWESARHASPKTSAEGGCASVHSLPTAFKRTLS